MTDPNDTPRKAGIGQGPLPASTTAQTARDPFLSAINRHRSPRSLPELWHGPMPKPKADPQPVSAAERIFEDLRYERYKQVFAGVSANDSSGATTNRTRTQPRQKPTTSRDKKKRSVIFGAIQLGVKGPKYCAELDRQRLAPPPAWKEEGCPDTYEKANGVPKWRKRIQDEKHRFQKRYDEASETERQEVIEGTAGTRRTRGTRR